MAAALIAYPVSAGDVQTRVLQCGAGRAALFIHGVGARADRWRANLAAFAGAGYRAMAVDLPGHGFADKGADVPATVPAMADTVRRLLDALSVERTTLVGTSLGGHVAAQVACELPHRVDALVLVGTLGLEPLGAEVGRMIADSIRDTAKHSIARKFAMVFADPASVPPETVEEEFRINNSRGAAASFACLADYFTDGIDAHVVGDRLAPLVERLPTLLVWGAADRVVVPEVGHRAAARLPGVPLQLIEGAGHAPYLEQPAAFNRVVLEFLAGHGD